MVPKIIKTTVMRSPGVHAWLQLDEKLAALVQRLRDAMRNRDFYVAFSQSPVDFINAVIASQVRRSPQCPEQWSSGVPCTKQGQWAVVRQRCSTCCTAHWRPPQNPTHRTPGLFMRRCCKVHRGCTCTNP